MLFKDYMYSYLRCLGIGFIVRDFNQVLLWLEGKQLQYINRIHMLSHYLLNSRMAFRRNIQGLALEFTQYTLRWNSLRLCTWRKTRPAVPSRQR